MVNGTNMTAATAASQLQNREAVPARPFTRLRSGPELTKPTDDAAGAAALTSRDSQAGGLDAAGNKFANAGSNINDLAEADASTQYARANILTQPGSAMLAQANLSPATVFELLQ
jgi:flagellin-like hook-associated protein FlgL